MYFKIWKKYAYIVVIIIILIYFGLLNVSITVLLYCDVTYCPKLLTCHVL